MKNGMRQLRYWEFPAIEKKLIHQILGRIICLRFKVRLMDARFDKGEFLIGIDCDVNRFERAIRKGAKESSHYSFIQSAESDTRIFEREKRNSSFSRYRNCGTGAGASQNFRIWIYHHFKNRMENICMSRF